MSKPPGTTDSVFEYHAGKVKWPRGWSRQARIDLARRVLEDEFRALREPDPDIGYNHGECSANMRAIAYVLLRELADLRSTSPEDCGKLHKAARILRNFEP